MKIEYSKSFQKRAATVDAKIYKKLRERLQIFGIIPFHPLLNNHALTGEYLGCRSINITGDWRAIYRTKNPNIAEFLKLGTHSELYD